VVEQVQEAIVGGLSNVWHKSNIAGETHSARTSSMLHTEKME
jgi:hypothetical protein